MGWSGKGWWIIKSIVGLIQSSRLEFPNDEGWMPVDSGTLLVNIWDLDHAPLLVWASNLCWSFGSLGLLVKFTFRAQRLSLHRLHLHYYGYEFQDIHPGVQMHLRDWNDHHHSDPMVPAIVGVFFLGIQRMNDPGKIFFMSISVSLVEASSENFSLAAG